VQNIFCRDIGLIYHRLEINNEIEEKNFSNYFSIISFGNIYTLLPRELNEIVSKDSMIKNIKKIEISYPNQEKNIVVIDKKSDIEKVVDYLIQKKLANI